VPVTLHEILRPVPSPPPPPGLPSEQAAVRLLRAVTDTGRRAFGAAACSIARLDEDAGLLVFEAASGEGGDRIVGTSFPASSGFAGWALAAQEPIVVDDIGTDERHARQVAERSGYLPSAILTAPLLMGDDAIGTLQVLDRDPTLRSSAESVALLGVLADHGAAALALLVRIRHARVVAEGNSDLGALARIASAANLPGAARVELFRTLADLLG
jgi:GAF domain-containing protein